MVDHIPTLVFGSDSEGEIDLSSQETAGGESPLSEKAMRMMWMTGTNTLNFLMFVGIAMFPAVCPAGCYYRATFPGGGRRLNSCFLACPPKRIKVKDSEGRDVLKGKACESGSKTS